MTSEFRTIHEIGDALIQLGKALKKMPNISSDETMSLNPKKQVKQLLTLEELSKFASEIRTLSREEVEKKLLELKFEELKYIAKFYKISIGKNINKSELIRKVLYNIFDYHAGHNLLRKFTSDTSEK